ncbi:MAG: hypothetical protein J3K34DRAFT_504209 [Monoraphidium minutum]|nr:MAG: hypothetical protein J3K34DRAFT_504209 [Monoraphidium minutum]
MERNGDLGRSAELKRTAKNAEIVLGKRRCRGEASGAVAARPLPLRMRLAAAAAAPAAGGPEPRAKRRRGADTQQQEQEQEPPRQPRRGNAKPQGDTAAAPPPQLQSMAGPRTEAADFFGVERQTNKKLYFRAFVPLGAGLRRALGLGSSNLRVGNAALLALYGHDSGLALNYTPQDYAAERPPRRRTDGELDAYLAALKCDCGPPSEAFLRSEAAAAAARRDEAAARAAARGGRARTPHSKGTPAPGPSSYAGVAPAPGGRGWDCVLTVDPPLAGRRRLVVGSGFASEAAAARAHDRAQLALRGAPAGLEMNFPLGSYSRDQRRRRTGAELVALLHELRLAAGERPTQALTGAAARAPPRCGLCRGCLRGGACAVAAEAARGSGGGGEDGGGEQEGTGAGNGGARRKSALPVLQAAHAAQEAMIAAHLRQQAELAAAPGAPPPLPARCAPLLRPSPPGPGAGPALPAAALLRRGGAGGGGAGDGAGPGSGGAAARELLEAAALASSAGFGQIAVDARSDAPRTCAVCMSPQHPARGCPAAARLAAPPAPGGGGGSTAGEEPGGGGGGEGGGGAWAERLSLADLEVLEAVRAAADALLPAAPAAGSGGGAAGGGGGAGGGGAAPAADARALLAAAVVLQEVAREALARSHAAGGLGAG